MGNGFVSRPVEVLAQMLAIARWPWLLVLWFDMLLWFGTIGCLGLVAVVLEMKLDEWLHGLILHRYCDAILEKRKPIIPIMSDGYHGCYGGPGRDRGA